MENKIESAFLFALEVHKNQQRKDGKPYIVHPFTVATELARNGAEDDLICAGLLHDTIEDGGVSPETLAGRFGGEVLRLVLFDTEDKSLSWDERKSAALTALESCDGKCAMLVCADKLANIRSIAEDITVDGETVWSQFRYGREKQEWLYREYVKSLTRLSNLEMYRNLKSSVEAAFQKGGK